MSNSRLQRSCLVVLALALAAGAPVPASAAGAIVWSRSTPGAGSLFTPAIGPDGTIYTSNGGRITAFAPDGEERWSVDVTTATGPVSVGADGTVYAGVGAVGANPTIIALRPDGTERWTFTADGSIHAGPNVGPDGSVYAVADTWFGGMGFFALDSEGTLLWSDAGDPQLSADTGQPHEIVFGAGLAYLSMTPQGGSSGDPPVLWAFDLAEREQAFTLLGSCQGQPVVNPFTGNLVTGNGLCQRVDTHDPRTGALLWSVPAPSQSPCSGLANIAAGPDGAVYTAFCYRAFWSLDAGGAERWFDDDFETYFQMTRLAVAPDNSLVLDLGGLPGTPGWIRAFSPETGTLQWQLELDHPGQKASSRPGFDPVRGRAYFNVHRFDTGTSDLVAVDLNGCAADVDGSGSVGLTDLLILLAGWGGPSADLDGDGVTGFIDLTLLLAAWGPCG